MLGIVHAREIVHDCRPFEDGKVFLVVVDDDGDFARGLEGGVPGLFLHALHEVDGLDGVGLVVGGFEFFEKDGDAEAWGCLVCCDLEWIRGFRGRTVRCAKHEELDALCCDEAGGLGHGGC